MVENINIEEVKKYNNTLQQYKSKAVQLNAEIEFITKEIDNLCAEMTTELGVPVTKENIEAICNDLAGKINTSLQSGNVVLSKIAEAENTGPVQPSATVNEQAQDVAVAQPVAPVQSMTVPQAPQFQQVMTQVPVQQQQMAGQFVQPNVGVQQQMPIYN